MCGWMERGNFGKILFNFNFRSWFSRCQQKVVPFLPEKLFALIVCVSHAAESASRQPRKTFQFLSTLIWVVAETHRPQKWCSSENSSLFQFHSFIFRGKTCWRFCSFDVLARLSSALSRGHFGVLCRESWDLLGETRVENRKFSWKDFRDFFAFVLFHLRLPLFPIFARLRLHIFTTRALSARLCRWEIPQRILNFIHMFLVLNSGGSNKKYEKENSNFHWRKQNRKCAFRSSREKSSYPLRKCSSGCMKISFQTQDERKKSKTKLKNNRISKLHDVEGFSKWKMFLKSRNWIRNFVNLLTVEFPAGGSAPKISWYCAAHPSLRLQVKACDCESLRIYQALSTPHSSYHQQCAFPTFFRLSLSVKAFVVLRKFEQKQAKVSLEKR